MEHVSTIIDRTFPTLRTAAPTGLVLAARSTATQSAPRPRTLPELAAVLEAEESLDNPDTTLQLRDLRLTDSGQLAVPGVGDFAFTDWSRRQCAAMLGLRWDKWFENATDVDRSGELNARFARGRGFVRLRTRRPHEGAGEPPILRAFVSPGYSAVADSEVAHSLADALSPADAHLRLIRQDVTDRTTSYVVAVGEPYKVGGDGEVGDVWGGLLVRNSGVGFASLFISLHLTRLLCKNGMTAPLPDALLLKRRHRGIDGGKLRSLLADRLDDVPGKLRDGAEILRAGRDRIVSDIEATFRTLLTRANLPMRMLADLVAAYRNEPSATAFGVSQAVTLAAQRFSPEIRLVLERAAGLFLSNSN